MSITGAQATFTRCHRDNAGMVTAFALFLHKVRFAGAARLRYKRVSRLRRSGLDPVTPAPNSEEGNLHSREGPVRLPLLNSHEFFSIMWPAYYGTYQDQSRPSLSALYDETTD